MSKHMDKLLQALDDFQTSHTKVYAPQLRSLIFSLYDCLMSELAEDAVFTLEDEGSMATITIRADSFLSGEQFPALQQLIHQAHTFQAEIRDGQIVFEMFFSFCEWIPRP